MEFQIKTDMSALPKTIDFNFEEMKQELTDKLKYYNSLVVTEDSIKNAKADKAKLNALYNAIEDKRKEIKKECMQPYLEFESKCKEITGLIKEPVQSIDNQIKVFEQQELDEKFRQLTEHYNAHIGDLSSLVPLERILNPKWQNKTAKLEDLKLEIENRIDCIKNDMQTISGLDSSFTLQMQDVYLRTLDLSKAVNEGKRLSEQQKQLNEIKRKQEEQNAALKAKLEAERQTQQKQAEPPEQPITSFSENKTPEPQKETEITTDFRVICTPSKLKALGEYMRNNGIKYGRVPKEEEKKNEW